MLWMGDHVQLVMKNQMQQQQQYSSTAEGLQLFEGCSKGSSSKRSKAYYVEVH